MLTEPFLSAKAVLENIERHNHQAYFVGGCVRDFLLKRPIGDIDIATSAPPDFIQQIFEKVIPVGIEHGTVIVRHQHESYEVTTFRIDGTYTDNRHPDSVKFIDKIDKDLERRDFTINALAMDKNGSIIDLFDGKKDIHNEIIRTVGDGFDRFTEDPLRIIRALRFSSQLGFEVHEDTLDEMKKVKHAIDNLAMERITNEFTKLFAGKYINNGIKYLRNTELYNHLPIIKDNTHIITTLPNPMKPLYSIGEVIALFHILDATIPIINWVKEWKCSNKTKQEANQLVEAVNNYNNHGLNSWLVYQLSNSYYNGFIRLINSIHSNLILEPEELKQIDQELPIKSKKELAVNGNDLIDLFPSTIKGPWLQQTLYKIEKEVVTGSLKNDNYEIKEWIKWNPPEIN